MQRHNDSISVIRSEYGNIIDSLGLFVPDGHFLYPADEQGSHLLRFFLADPIAEREDMISMIVDDIVQWAIRENIRCDVVFAPAQSAVREIAYCLARSLGQHWQSTCRTAFLEYLSTGRFGTVFAEGMLKPGDRVLVFNGVTQQGRCVGERLPGFVKRYNAEVVAAAVFAKGTTSLIQEVERRYGSRFFAAVEVNVPVWRPEECPRCLAGDTASLQPWTDLLKIK